MSNSSLTFPNCYGIIHHVKRNHSSENLSKESLKSTFDAAFTETLIDEEEDLQMRDGDGYYVFARKNHTRMMILFRTKENANHQEQLKFANHVNARYMIACVDSSDKRSTIGFEYDIPVEGGITKQDVVLAMKPFLSTPINAIQEHGSNMIR